MAMERYASGAWLTPRLITFAAGLVIAGTVVALRFLLVSAGGTVGGFGPPFGTAFSRFWSSGHRAGLSGRARLPRPWPDRLSDRRAPGRRPRGASTSRDPGRHSVRPVGV